MIDKGRADLQGNVGEYHFACPLDQMLFEFKGVQADDVKKLLGSGATDEQVVAWFDSHGAGKTAQEIKTWSNGVRARPVSNRKKREGPMAVRLRLVTSIRCALIGSGRDWNDFETKVGRWK
jgi:Domain of unknown function (DUF5069)